MEYTFVIPLLVLEPQGFEFYGFHYTVVHLCFACIKILEYDLPCLVLVDKLAVRKTLYELHRRRGNPAAEPASQLLHSGFGKRILANLVHLGSVDIAASEAHRISHIDSANGHGGEHIRSLLV